jgi:serine/threonine protein kinase
MSSPTSSSAASSAGNAASSASSDAPQKKVILIGEYEYVHGKRLGSGAFATVYYAEHHESRAPAAIKAISLEKAGRPGEPSHRYLASEIKIMARMQHPNILRLLDRKDSNKHTYLMYAPSTSLCCCFLPHFFRERVDCDLVHFTTSLS